MSCRQDVGLQWQWHRLGQCRRQWGRGHRRKLPHLPGFHSTPQETALWSQILHQMYRPSLCHCPSMPQVSEEFWHPDWKPAQRWNYVVYGHPYVRSWGLRRLRNNYHHLHLSIWKTRGTVEWKFVWKKSCNQLTFNNNNNNNKGHLSHPLSGEPGVLTIQIKHTNTHSHTQSHTRTRL